MARDFDQIASAAAKMQTLQSESQVLSTPPGYIAGLEVRYRQDNTVTVFTGTANVRGLLVRLQEDHMIVNEDWIAPPMDLSRFYFIMIGADGNIRVDSLEPTWNAQYAYLENSNLNMRCIGKLFRSGGKTIFAISDVKRRFE